LLIPPYSPDLAPSDFSGFAEGKKQLIARSIRDGEELLHEVMDMLGSIQIIELCDMRSTTPAIRIAFGLGQSLRIAGVIHRTEILSRQHRMEKGSVWGVSRTFFIANRRSVERI
jgi:hypothetical protein